MGGPEKRTAGTYPPARSCQLSRCDVGRLQTLGALRHFELHPGAFIQGAISLRLDRREVNEDVFSVLPLDKAVAFGRVKPLHCSFFFHLPIFLLNVVLICPEPPQPQAAPGNKKRAAEWTHAAPSRTMYEAENKSQMLYHYTTEIGRASCRERV